MSQERNHSEIEEKFSEYFQQHNRNVTRLRNPDIFDNDAWQEAQDFLHKLIPDYTENSQYNPTLVKQLFLASRHAYILRFSRGRTEEAYGSYRVERRRVLSEVSDDDFETHIKFVELFERGLFWGILPK